MTEFKGFADDIFAEGTAAARPMAQSKKSLVKPIDTRTIEVKAITCDFLSRPIGLVTAVVSIKKSQAIPLTSRNEVPAT